MNLSNRFCRCGQAACFEAFASLLLITIFNLPASTYAQGVTGEPAATQPTAAAEAQAQQIAKNRQKVIEVLKNEINNLLPGEPVADSPSQKSIAAGAEAFATGNLKQALVDLGKVHEADPSLPPAEIFAAGMCFTSKDLAVGNRLMEQAAIKFPQHPSVYAAYGRLAVSSNRNVDGLLHFEKLKSLLGQSQFSDAVAKHYQIAYLDGMADIALRQNRLEDARAFTNQHRELRPKYTKPIMILADIEFKEDNVQGSLKLLNELNALSPSARVPEAIISSWYSQRGDKENTASWIAKVATKYPDDAQAQIEYASWCISEEQFEQATQTIAKAESIAGENSLSKSLKGKIAFANQKYKVAAQLYQSLLPKSNDPDFANMYALCLAESDDAEQKKIAGRIAAQNFKAKPNNLVALAALGYVLTKTDDSNPQIPAIFTRIAQARGAMSPEMQFFVANYLVMVGDNTNATKLLDQCLAHDGLFLYRQQASQLKAKIANSELPTPKSK
jgi:uncharacterized membrane-anchored protein